LPDNWIVTVTMLQRKVRAP